MPAPHYKYYERIKTLEDAKTLLHLLSLCQQIDIDGHKVGYRKRYRMFNEKGCKCVICGIEGTYLILERPKSQDQAFHLNLYGTNKYGEEVMMTIDHIVPKSKGGLDTLENYQTMCEDCNSAKGNNL